MREEVKKRVCLLNIYCIYVVNSMIQGLENFKIGVLLKDKTKGDEHGNT